MKKKVLMAMSGGVDSSTAALLLQEAGYDVTGVTLRMFRNEDIGLEEDSRCCSLSDTEDARLVAHRLGIPFYVFNFCDAFRHCVIDHFIDEYNRGRTPNPCVDCNRDVKLGRLYPKAELLGCDYIATGHYANVAFDGASGRWLLQRGDDEKKDQSYMLYTLSQEQLGRTLFPLGHLHKEEIRARAGEAGLRTARKPDSQDICFVPDGDYARVIRTLTGQDPRPGPFVHVETGEVLGTHKGQLHYTIGQRKGLGIAYACPLFVIRKDLERNIVYVGPREALFARSLIAADCNLISVPSLPEPLHVTAKPRYHARDVGAVITSLGNGRIRVTFDEPQRALTPGQAVVFYEGTNVVGGGTIDVIEREE